MKDTVTFQQNEEANRKLHLELTKLTLNQFIEHSNMQIDDIGNEIGIVVGKYLKNEDDINLFIQGIEHGISLINGTH